MYYAFWTRGQLCQVWIWSSSSSSSSTRQPVVFGKEEKKFILRQHKYRDHNSLKEEQVWSTSAHMSVWRHIPFLSRKFRKHFPTQAPPTGSQSESDLSRAGAGLEKHGNIHSVRWITVTLMSQFSIIHCSHMETETQLFWQSNNKNRSQRIKKKKKDIWTQLTWNDYWFLTVTPSHLRAAPLLFPVLRSASCWLGLSISWDSVVQDSVWLNWVYLNTNTLSITSGRAKRP